MFGKRSSRKQFLYQRSYLDRRLQHDVMEDGIAYVPCRVQSMGDIISKFSVGGVECLNSEFLNYILEYADFIPSEYPMVLDLYGPSFTPEEKKIIRETVAADMDYLLGKTEETIHRRRRRMAGMIAGTVISGAVLTFAKQWWYEIPLELLYVIFWLFADSFVRYLFIEKLDFREEKIRMGRLAGLQVRFTEQAS